MQLESSSYSPFNVRSEAAMEVKTYRAASMQAALQLVRSDLGAGAAVLHTREVPAIRMLGWLPGMKRFEVTASTQVTVPSRMPPRRADQAALETTRTVESTNERVQFRTDVQEQLSGLQSLVEDLCRRTRGGTGLEMPPALFKLYTDLMDAEISEKLANELVERVREELAGGEMEDASRLRARVLRLIENEIHVTGPIQPRGDRCHLVALVGPTGVGKTTTIAKLAANFRLREKRRIGLITVDTYRIAAVEQLRTYADIIDLPMQVVSTPAEMRAAVARMQDLDLVLLDTAGRSPKDEVKIQELRELLMEAGADEVHLVLSAVASPTALQRTAERFATVGTTALLLTKLDEAGGLGNLLPMLRESKLPLSYLTNGQNVPDDIVAADRTSLAQAVLGMQAI